MGQHATVGVHGFVHPRPQKETFHLLAQILSMLARKTGNDPLAFGSRTVAILAGGQLWTVAVFV